MTSPTSSPCKRRMKALLKTLAIAVLLNTFLVPRDQPPTQMRTSTEIRQALPTAAGVPAKFLPSIPNSAPPSSLLSVHLLLCVCVCVGGLVNFEYQSFLKILFIYCVHACVCVCMCMHM
jgi:hypothetical protein